eukprot:TRINITY_DN79212_c0_g1_i1.p1 TRINITY_DN79212_c0_g1~~TRINITY_DN79212_c0_g1_i1.p1  ORF type:complete len:212 (-),score=45.06 TRINITY_DN79212_c0_g1_i1:52-687(-)
MQEPSPSLTQKQKLRRKTPTPLFLVIALLAAGGVLQLRCAFAGTKLTDNCHGPKQRHRQLHLLPRPAGLGDLMGAMPKMMEAAKKLPELQQRLRETPSTGEALGGKVKVTLSGDLAPLGIVIDESLVKEGLPAQVIADGVLVAMKEAHNASVELSKTELANFYKGMGMPMPSGGSGGLPGMPQASAPSPPPIPAESLNFDPAGLGGTRAVD